MVVLNAQQCPQQGGQGLRVCLWGEVAEMPQTPAVLGSVRVQPISRQ